MAVVFEQESDNYIIRSLNHHKYFQQTKNQHYFLPILNDVMKVISKVNLGDED